MAPAGAGAADQQDHRRHGAGAGDQRGGQREDRGVICLICRGFCRLALAPLGAAFEEHVERGEEEEKPAGDAEGGHGDADAAQELFAEEAEEGQQHGRDTAGAQADGTTLAGVHALGQGDEQGGEPDGIDHDEQGDEGGDVEREVGHGGSVGPRGEGCKRGCGGRPECGASH